MKKCSVLLIMKEMQIKTSMSFDKTSCQSECPSFKNIYVQIGVEKMKPSFFAEENINWCRHNVENMEVLL